MSTSIADLPTTCLLEIFFKLPIGDRLRCGQVCRQWAEVSTFSDLRHLNIFDLPLVKKSLTVGSLTDLSFAPHSVILDALNSILPRTSVKLKSISFHSNQWWWEATFDQLQLINNFCPQLHSLTLANCDFRHVSEANLVELINQLANLRSFALFYADHFVALLGKNTFAREFFALNWSLLERLEMSTDVTFPSGYTEEFDFDAAISRLAQLRYVGLNATSPSYHSFRQLSRTFSSCLQLTEVKLSFFRNSWPQLTYVDNLQHLKLLELRGKYLDDSNVLPIGELSALSELVIESEFITDVGVTSLLRNCPQLTTLHLLKTKISAQIFRVIGDCPNLRHFHLCPILPAVMTGLQLLLVERSRRRRATQLAIHTNLPCDEDVLQRLQQTNVSLDYCHTQPH